MSLDEEFEDLRPCCSEDPEEKPRCFYGSSPHHLEDPSLSELENFSSEIISFKSMEDLVNGYTRKTNERNLNVKKQYFSHQGLKECLEPLECLRSFCLPPEPIFAASEVASPNLLWFPHFSS